MPEDDSAVFTWQRQDGTKNACFTQDRVLSVGKQLTFMKLNSLVHTIAFLALSLTLSSADHHGKAKKAFAFAGAWKSKAESDANTRHYTFTFEEKDSKWSGHSEDEDGNVRKMARVKVERNKITAETDIERDGQTGIIRVVAEGDESGNAFEGKWSVIDSTDTEQMSGEFTAERIFELKLVGDWVAVATVGEEEIEASVQFKVAATNVVGSFKGEDGKEVKFTKITAEDKAVTLEFSNSVNNTELGFRISAKAKNADELEGKWVVFDPTGQKGYSGKWIAKRVIPFALAGIWSATSELPDGNSNSSTYTIAKNDDVFSGKVASDTTEIDLSSVTLKDEKVTIVFPFGAAKVTITAELKGKNLDGKWALPTPDGELSGKWAAKPKE